VYIGNLALKLDLPATAMKNELFCMVLNSVNQKQKAALVFHIPLNINMQF